MPLLSVMKKDGPPFPRRWLCPLLQPFFKAKTLLAPVFWEATDPCHLLALPLEAELPG